MTRSRERRSRLGMTWFALALGALALLAMPALAAAKDRNHDHIPDKWEKKYNLSLKVNQARKDQDGDHLRNRAEFLAGDNPRDEDSNDDGVSDGEENAGTIATFDTETGKLTIDLFGDETISGFVSEETEIECDDQSGAAASSDGEPGEDSGEEADSGDEGEPGDAGDGEEEAGDGSGTQAEEPGDDSGENAGNCTSADLVPGAVVQEAELQVVEGKAAFEEIELSGNTSSP